MESNACLAAAERLVSARGQWVAVVTQLEPNDVLMGRGAPVANYAGNVLFRQLVSTRKLDYGMAGRHAAKQVIARQVYAEIGKREGRFLSKLAPGTVTKTTAHNHWYVANEEVALEKVKQALRGKHDFVEPPTAAAAAIVIAPVVVAYTDAPRLGPGLVVGGQAVVRAADLRSAVATAVTPPGSFLQSNAWSLSRPEQQRLWAFQQQQQQQQQQHNQHPHQQPLDALMGTNALSDIVGGADLSNDTSGLTLLQQVQQDNAVQQMMAAQAELQGPSQQHPLMHLSNGDLLEILQHDSRTRIEQQEQQQRQMQMASQWQRQQIASQLLQQQQDDSLSQLPDLVSRGPMPGQSVRSWPLLPEPSSFPVHSGTVHGSVSAANSAHLSASMTPPEATMGGSSSRTLHDDLSTLLRRNGNMISEPGMNFPRAMNRTGFTSVDGISYNQQMVQWGNQLPTAPRAPSPNNVAVLGVGAEGPPIENKPRARDLSETLAEKPAKSAKRVRENE
jgi:hypothetical protein